MKYVYIVYRYQPKHKYANTIYEGSYHHNHLTLVCETYEKAIKEKRKWKYSAYIRKKKLR